MMAAAVDSKSCSPARQTVPSAMAAFAVPVTVIVPVALTAAVRVTPQIAAQRASSGPSAVSGNACSDIQSRKP